VKLPALRTAWGRIEVGEHLHELGDREFPPHDLPRHFIDILWRRGLHKGIDCPLRYFHGVTPR
jgi:hypothetical protein